MATTYIFDSNIPFENLYSNVKATEPDKYAGTTEETKQIMRDGLKKLNTVEPMVEIPVASGGTRMVKQSEQARINAILATIPH